MKTITLITICQFLTACLFLIILATAMINYFVSEMGLPQFQWYETTFALLICIIIYAILYIVEKQQERIHQIALLSAANSIAAKSVLGLEKAVMKIADEAEKTE